MFLDLVVSSHKQLGKCVTALLVTGVANLYLSSSRK